MIALFKKKSARWSILVIVVIILVGTFGIAGRKKANKDNTTKNKNTAGTKIASNTEPSSKSSSSDDANTKPVVTSKAESPQQSETVQDSKSQPSSEESAPSEKTVSPKKTVPSEKIVSSEQTAPSKKTISPEKTAPPVKRVHSQKKVISASSQKYVSNNLGFSVTFPASWKNKYTVEEDNNGLIIKFKPVSNPINGGMLFEIIKKSPDFDEGMTDCMGKRYITAKGVTYIIGGPMDVGFPTEHPEYGEYRKLSKELSSVMSTIKSID